MTFVHDDPEFEDLLGITAGKRGLAPGLIEKDYWVTHALWALHEQGFDVWFKGGTSLSKGFGLIERFSEDLDLKVDPGATTLPAVSNWKSEGTKATAERRTSFQALATMLVVPGAGVETDTPPRDPTWRNVEFRVVYPRKFLAELPGPLRPFVLLEIGHARVTPFVERDLTSFVHQELEGSGQLGDYADNRPRRVRCVHPLVTLLEKLDAISRRAPQERIDPAVFARHFEDAARIILAAGTLPDLDGYATVGALAEEMVAESRQIAVLPRADDPAFALPPGERTRAIRQAYAAIAPMYWGKRMDLDDACGTIRDWIARSFR